MDLLLLVGLATIVWMIAEKLALVFCVLFAVINEVVFGAFWGGKTIGKFLVKIHVITESGKPPGIFRMIVRFFFKFFVSDILYFYGFAMMLRSERSQTLHDRVSKTLVIDG